MRIEDEEPLLDIDTALELSGWTLGVAIVTLAIGAVLWL